MISSALQQLPSQQGTLDEIYAVIEEQHGKTLNFENESGPRQIPVPALGFAPCGAMQTAERCTQSESFERVARGLCRCVPLSVCAVWPIVLERHCLTVLPRCGIPSGVEGERA